MSLHHIARNTEKRLSARDTGKREKRVLKTYPNMIHRCLYPRTERDFFQTRCVGPMSDTAVVRFVPSNNKLFFRDPRRYNYDFSTVCHGYACDNIIAVRDENSADVSRTVRVMAPAGQDP